MMAGCAPRSLQMAKAAIEGVLDRFHLRIAEGDNANAALRRSPELLDDQIGDHLRLARIVAPAAPIVNGVRHVVQADAQLRILGLR